MTCPAVQPLQPHLRSASSFLRCSSSSRSRSSSSSCTHQGRAAHSMGARGSKTGRRAGHANVADAPLFANVLALWVQPSTLLAQPIACATLGCAELQRGAAPASWRPHLAPLLLRQPLCLLLRLALRLYRLLHAPHRGRHLGALLALAARGGRLCCCNKGRGQAHA